MPVLNSAVSNSLYPHMFKRPGPHKLELRNTLRVRGFVRSNERNHYLFIPHIENKGGGYLGVASDQNFTLMAAARSDYARLVDYGTYVPTRILALKSLIQANSGPEEFIKGVERFVSDDRGYIDETLGLLNESEQEAFRNIGYIFSDKDPEYYRQVQKQQQTWLNSPDSYEYIKWMFTEHLIQVWQADLSDSNFYRELDRETEAIGQKISVAYLSNAESHIGNRSEGVWTSYARGFSRLNCFSSGAMILKTIGRSETPKKVQDQDRENSDDPFYKRDAWHYNIASFDISRRMLDVSDFSYQAMKDLLAFHSQFDFYSYSFLTKGFSDTETMEKKKRWVERLKYIHKSAKLISQKSAKLPKEIKKIRSSLLGIQGIFHPEFVNKKYIELLNEYREFPLIVNEILSVMELHRNRQSLSEWIEIYKNTKNQESKSIIFKAVFVIGFKESRIFDIYGKRDECYAEVSSEERLNVVGKYLQNSFARIDDVVLGFLEKTGDDRFFALENIIQEIRNLSDHFSSMIDQFICTFFIDKYRELPLIVEGIFFEYNYVFRDLDNLVFLYQKTNDFDSRLEILFQICKTEYGEDYSLEQLSVLDEAFKKSSDKEKIKFFQRFNLTKVNDILKERIFFDKLLDVGEIQDSFDLLYFYLVKDISNYEMMADFTDEKLEKIWNKIYELIPVASETLPTNLFLDVISHIVNGMLKVDVLRDGDFGERISDRKKEVIGFFKNQMAGENKMASLEEAIKLIIDMVEHNF